MMHKKQRKPLMLEQKSMFQRHQSYIVEPILLVSISTLGNPSIAPWECLTDADSYFGILIYGEIVPSNRGRSFITRYTTNPYLALCTYVSVKNPLF